MKSAVLLKNKHIITHITVCLKTLWLYATFERSRKNVIQGVGQGETEEI